MIAGVDLLTTSSTKKNNLTSPIGKSVNTQKLTTSKN